ncbi:MerR family transcriptional regulator [Corynebacterium sp. CCM 9185]|uniref:MerR family transcriptional regulator n=2 Tax=Corynebacterium marambiense TaxID=2765364 RepID=A0ABS0VSP5_9CORY|nr:MerR family transcriptional regulator [Corynebacterium marambiense]MBI8999784.1 MerR family transcriptional regulator [Corynebacterium marambiense]MCK7662624.1 MerR family transcriptional regulator [Corynebacterium marambiense]
MNHYHGLRIGVFSQLTGISVRMLRHYGMHGVLTPAMTDPATGYRFYSSDQIPQALLVTRLRDAGFPVRAISTILESRGDSVVLSTLTEERRTAIMQDMATAQEQLRALTNLNLRETVTPVAVTRTVFPATDVVSLREVLPTYNDEHGLWERLQALTIEQATPCALGGIAGAVYHDAEFRESETDVEIFVQVTEPCQPGSPLVHRALPERDVVTATLHGSYERMGTVTAQIGAYLVEHGLEAGPMINLYRVSPAQDPNPDNWVTDVVFPLIQDDMPAT